MLEATAANSEAPSQSAMRHNWSHAEVLALFNLPFNDLLFQAQTVHRAHFDPNAVQLSTLLSIKTGACPEDCAYCPQSVRYDTGLEKEALMEVERVRASAAKAKEAGASRFCMGAAWRSPKQKDMATLIAMIDAVKEQGMETCVTAGMLNEAQVAQLEKAGLDYYNHNLDTSEEYYQEIISTRTYQDRLDTLERLRGSDIKVCCGGIVGMGEGRPDRVELLRTLANLPAHPQSVPINELVRVPGTPLALEENEADAYDNFEFIRTIAVARILMPESHVRLSAGRSSMSEETQALCFMAGANSIFYGEQLLTTGNPEHEKDQALFQKLGLHPETRGEAATTDELEVAPSLARNVGHSSVSQH